LPIRRHHLRKNIVYSDNIKDSQAKTADIEDSAVTGAKIADGAVDNAKIAVGTITYDRLAAGTIQFNQEITLLGGAAQSVSADVVATLDVEHTLERLTSEHIRHAVSMWAMVDYTWAATANGTIQLYDETNAAVLGESTGKVGGESAEYESFSVAAPATTPVDIRCRVNITAAGAAGETVTVYRARLIVVTKVS